MNRDSLYQKIAIALEKLDDGNAFERCAVALLCATHPNLAPVHGGDDAGMDGAFGTSEGAYPLVCTVQSDVIGNFNQNIASYLAKRKGPKLVAIATSRQLTNLKKRNLETRAEELGVTITNIYDAPYFVNLLYRDSKWRLDLLGITGNPVALSKLPKVGRFVNPEILVGRDKDLEWLQQVEGDALLVGPPGSGKTYLHQYLANDGRCLFAVNNSDGQLADAIRDQEPSIIVVDDAHVEIELVQNLKRLRSELGASYSIHLNCWPRSEAIVQRVLNIPASRVRRLELLTRQQIFELIKQLGINGPDWLQHLLISQSDGKPGLAVALADSCKTDDVANIWNGEVAARQLLGDLRLVRDEKERCILASFAIGGDAGMSFGDVAHFLQLSGIELRQITAGLGAGGLIEEVSDDRLQVRPAALRAVLVRNVFFGGPDSPPVGALLNATPSLASTATVLLSVKQRNGKVPYELLERFVVAADDRGVWEHFGWIDVETADTILDKYPQQVCKAANGLLNYQPTRSLHALLDDDEASFVEQSGAVEHPRRRISEWLFPLDEAPNTTVDRRVMLLGVLEDRVKKGRIGSGRTFTWALAELLEITFDVATSSPGNFLQINCVRGVAAPPILKKIAGLWPRIRELFRYVPNSVARMFFDQLEKWFIPQRLTTVAEISDETIDVVRVNGRQMLSEMIAMPHCNQAWRVRAKQLAEWGKLDLIIEVDDVFDALYSDRDRAGDWLEVEKKRVQELQAIADKLVRRPVEDVLSFLLAIQFAATEFRIQQGTGYLSVIYHHIAQHCADPLNWFESVVGRSVSSDLVVPFLDRIVSTEMLNYHLCLHQLIEIPIYQPLAITRLMHQSDADDTLLSTALELLNDPKFVDRHSMVDSRITTRAMARLLQHKNSHVRAAAAVGEWQSQPTGTIREELVTLWRSAVREIGRDEYALTEIFENHVELAYEWFEAKLVSASIHFSEYDFGLLAAVKYLDKRQRGQLLQLINRENYSDDCFDMVMGTEIDLFAAWLTNQPDEYLRLRPLDRDVGPRWEQMALMALDFNVSPEDLAEHCTPRSWGGTGSMSTYFNDRLPVYEKLASHSDPRLRIAGKRGLEIMQIRAKRELDRERREETYGYR